MRRRGSYSEQAVDTIVAQADQLARLIDDLLLTSQIESDRLDLRLAETDLVAEVRAAAEHLRAERASIRVEAPSGELTVLADPQRLGQVFANLLTNAIKYSPPGSEILVRVMPGPREVSVSVVDQGAGIPREALPHLFDRFYRATGSARSASGLGLGLYITRQIVESHSGKISVESEPGRGSTFTVTLPLSMGSPH
jgi:signal transduction histidine kinase